MGFKTRLHARESYCLHIYLPAYYRCLHTASQRSMSSTTAIGPSSNSTPDAVWAESPLQPQPAVVPQPAPVKSSAHLVGQSIAELAQICREQAEELEGGPLIGKHACRLVAPQLHLHPVVSCSQRRHHQSFLKETVKFGSSVNTTIPHSCEACAQQSPADATRQ